MYRDNKPVFAPCGKCECCLVNRQNQWSTRLNEELNNSKQAFFFTLTYNDEFLPMVFPDYPLSVKRNAIAICDDDYGNRVPTLWKKDIQDFMKRLRNHFSSKSIVFYAIGEYGPDTHRPHYHGLIFFKDRLHLKSHIEDLFNKSWKNGFISLDDVNQSRIDYVSGYFLSKLWSPAGVQPCFSQMSKGIGKDYITRMSEWHWNGGTDRFYVPYMDKKRPLPRYYKEKIYDSVFKEDFNQIMQEKAEQEHLQQLEEFGNEESLKAHQYELRASTARQIRKLHKKKML